MQRFEYKVIPAPRRGEKARGVKSTEDRFALTVAHLMNEMAAEGWEYLRADTLPCDERTGLTGTKTTFQSLLVFRRDLGLAGEGDAAPVAALPDLRAAARDDGAAPRLGVPDTPEGKAPALGPAKADD